MPSLCTIIDESVSENVFADPLIDNFDDEILTLLSAQQFHKAYPDHV